MLADTGVAASPALRGSFLGQALERSAQAAGTVDEGGAGATGAGMGPADAGVGASPARGSAYATER
eukprot:2767654-Pleurochrysis_carterae.AAC.1